MKIVLNKNCFKTLILMISLTASLNHVQSQTEPKKVFIHYMGWFNSAGRHWSYGHANNPLIGEYNSLSWSLLTYHILLSWSCGIDGLIINVKDAYDHQCLNMLYPTLKTIRIIDSTLFKYEFTISYDDQGMTDLATAQNKFICLRDTILPNTRSFLQYQGVPSIFAFNYPNQYLTAHDFVTALNSTFPTNRPKFIWNEIDENALGYADSFFPWVQPGGIWNGSNWGKIYLQWFYPTVAGHGANIDFACGGVWPGFDDRPNHSWGQNRWIDRKNGVVYDSTWLFVQNYSGALPLKWIVIETWNDWNEATEIEPSVEHGYKYLQQTVDNINEFKSSNFSKDTVKFELAKIIYMAGNLIENNRIDSAEYYPILENVIRYFLEVGRYGTNINVNQGDIKTLLDAIKEVTFVFDNNTNEKEIYFNTSQNKLYIDFHENIKDFKTIEAFTIDGRKFLTKPVTTTIETIDFSSFSKDICIVKINSINETIVKKIYIQ